MELENKMNIYVYVSGPGCASLCVHDSEDISGTYI